MDQIRANTPVPIKANLMTEQRLAKRPLVFNGRFANRQLTSLVKEATCPGEMGVVRVLAPRETSSHAS